MVVTHSYTEYLPSCITWAVSLVRWQAKRSIFLGSTLMANLMKRMEYMHRAVCVCVRTHGVCVTLCKCMCVCVCVRVCVHGVCVHVCVHGVCAHVCVRMHVCVLLLCS